MEVQNRLQRRLREIVWHHLVLLRPDTSIARAIRELVQLPRVSICLLILMPGTAVVEIGVIHGSNIFRYLLESQINILLIALQIIFEAINFQTYLVDGILYRLLFLLSTSLLGFLILDYCWVDNWPNCIFVCLLDLELVCICHSLVRW